MRVNIKPQDLLDWLKWNAGGRKPELRLRPREVEIDVTTCCSGLPSCRADCTYRHSRNKGERLDYFFARDILQQLLALGVEKLIFSGGGEPLEPFPDEIYRDIARKAKIKNVPGVQNIAINFIGILNVAGYFGFENVLLTNGVYLGWNISPQILRALKLLRISIPPVLHGYDHLDRIHDNIEAAVCYKKDQDLPVKIVASLLIRPDTPQGEITDRIATLNDLGVDLVRFKPTHLWREDGSRSIGTTNYHDITQFILGLNHPKVKVAKINRLLTEDVMRTYNSCYYADFNPLVIGADGLNYACCETKYLPAFKRGNLHQNSILEILGLVSQKPQPVLPACFSGCKGDLANRHLHVLVKAYQAKTDAIFDEPKYLEHAEAALAALVRSALEN